MQGVKNEQGVYITPAFPKLIYVLEEDNIHEDSKYWYLTEIAAQCTAKRMVPDYISEKKMKELKNLKDNAKNRYGGRTHHQSHYCAEHRFLGNCHPHSTSYQGHA